MAEQGTELVRFDAVRVATDDVARAARAYALLLGRNHVLPEDVQALFIAVAGHRLSGEAEAGSGAALAKAVLHAVPVD